MKKNHMHLYPNSFKTNIEVGRTVFHSFKPGQNESIYKLTLYHSNQKDDSMPEQEKEDEGDDMKTFMDKPFLMPKANKYVEQPSDTRATKSSNILHRAIIAFSQDINSL